MSQPLSSNQQTQEALQTVAFNSTTAPVLGFFDVVAELALEQKRQRDNKQAIATR